eukprot:SAG31_NODE_2927_length_4900_cov_42.568314_5_plen_200_part_00
MFVCFLHPIDKCLLVAAGTELGDDRISVVEFCRFLDTDPRGQTNYAGVVAQEFQAFNAKTTNAHHICVDPKTVRLHPTSTKSDVDALQELGSNTELHENSISCNDPSSNADPKHAKLLDEANVIIDDLKLQVVRASRRVQKADLRTNRKSPCSPFRGWVGILVATLIFLLAVVVALSSESMPTTGWYSMLMDMCAHIFA